MKKIPGSCGYFSLSVAMPLSMADSVLFVAAPLRLKSKYRSLRSLHLSIEGTTYRIIYQIFQKSEMIVVRLAASREKINRRLDEMKLKP